MSAIIDALFAFEATEHRRAIAQDKLGLPVVFKNAKPPSPPTATLKLKINHHLPPDEKIQRARGIVNAFLSEHGIVPIFCNSADVVIVDDDIEWLKVGRKHDMATTPTERIRRTEGYTTQNSIQPPNSKEQPPTAKVFINGNNHTIGAIVHEIFHSISSPALSDVWEGAGPPLEEALTEYMTCVASRQYLRHDIAGDPLYERGLGILRDGIGEGGFTEADLILAYFHCTSELISPISKYFYLHLNK
ncbi:hypothetical protein FHW68_000651 [Pseudomonas sp. Tn43]|uniref:hypothetical protein n=1 Tax=Pseudomonas TaxID=286 RepID=UPI00161B0D2F|nr:hypothetical protein [Pseudomonas sp. Tn43]MBB3239179.1 hypothetical protein [Pseudomonas sp. Tn43]